MLKEYNKLNDKYVEAEHKIATINGLLMAQAMCSRMLITKHSPDILELMNNIALAVDNIKNN